MKVENVGANKYAFDFGGGAETIVVDGTDQPGVGGTSLSVTAEGPNQWKVVRKKEGRVLLTAIWKLSQDGKTLTDDFTSVNPNGETSNVVNVYQRRAGRAGFSGTWVCPSQTMSSVIVVRVQPYLGDGLSFINPSQETTTNVRFDGKDYPRQGPNLPAGLTTSMRKVNAHTLEMTDKYKDNIIATRELDLSPDAKTLTMTVHPPGQAEPNVLVFERQ